MHGNGASYLPELPSAKTANNLSRRIIYTLVIVPGERGEDKERRVGCAFTEGVP